MFTKISQIAVIFVEKTSWQKVAWGTTWSFTISKQVYSWDHLPVDIEKLDVVV